MVKLTTGCPKNGVPTEMVHLKDTEILQFSNFEAEKPKNCQFDIFLNLTYQFQAQLSSLPNSKKCKMTVFIRC